ncbi:MAG TPA: ATP-dependent DNA helicase RecQ [Balneolaceae bacterium]
MDDALFKKAQQNLQKYWGYDSFRPGQDEAIQSVLNGKDTMVLFPTGGGKSLCYQIPATVLEGLTVVISPLIALMQDQVQQLKKRDISATFINSTISTREVEQRLVNARNGMYDLLYCAPERLNTHLWQAELPDLNIDLVAIDEAHCISEWGHDFRPDYRKIRPAFESVADEITWIALTATATPEVRDDIQKNLEFDGAAVISKGFERPNLKWWVVETPKKDEKLLRAVKKAAREGSGLIYGGTRRNCTELSDKIERNLGIKTKAYHAGIDSSVRKQIQQEWIDGTLPLVAATNAFGMGIDKADCRYVIHYQMPYSLESYYQEAGRAGRDGEESYPLLLYKSADAIVAEKRIKDSYPEKEQLQLVYDVLCDSLELAVGAEMEATREVSIKALKKRSGLPSRIVHSSLKVLNHVGVIQLIENITPQIGLQFIAHQDYVREQIDHSKNQQKAAFVDVLLRQFGNQAFEKVKYLDFGYIRRKLNVSPNAVKKGLQVLQDHDHLIKYEIIGEQPLFRLIEERQSSLRLSKKELEKYRNSLLKKLEYMKQYIETENCREVFIRRYFGEENVLPCGHCDNCLKNGGNLYLSDSDIQQIKVSLSEEPKTFYELCGQFGWSESRTKQSLGYLIREEKVVAEADKYFWKE